MTRYARIGVSVAVVGILALLSDLTYTAYVAFNPLDSPITVAGGSISVRVDQIAAGRVWTPYPAGKGQVYSAQTDNNDYLWTEGMNSPPGNMSGNNGWTITITTTPNNKTITICSDRNCSLALERGMVYAKVPDGSHWGYRDNLGNGTDRSQRFLYFFDDSQGCDGSNAHDPCNTIATIVFQGHGSSASNFRCRNPSNCQIHIGSSYGSFRRYVDDWRRR
jgi:hypothetical protein